MSSAKSATLEDIVSLCKRRGFIYPAAEIYGGLNGVYDFGHLGTLLKQNVRNSWLKSIGDAQENIVFFEGSLLSPKAVWEGSGHLENFHDPMVDCLNCKHRYRADEINLEKPCPTCGKIAWTDARMFNMMFKTEVGAETGTASAAYLRPETAQSIFINFKNIAQSNRTKIPFGIAQIGTSFRNEINPKHFLFRVREFEQMELEWFCTEKEAPQFFEFWAEHQHNFCTSLGLKKENVRIRDYEKNELAHYAIATSDIEYAFPFGWKELEGIANRGDYDLTRHSKYSGKDLSVYDEQQKKSYFPYVVESSIGIGRLVLSLLLDAYDTDLAEDQERIVLRFSPAIAPIKAAILPLTKHQQESAHKIYHEVKTAFSSHVGCIEFDESGSIGKRYRRQDEIGTPFCFTYDFESDSDGAVTVRDRDTMQQERIAFDKIIHYLQEKISSC